MILIRPSGKHFSVMHQVLQMRSGLLQSVHTAVLVHGVFRPGCRMALAGAA
jgi:hypothetical protein